MNIRPIVYKWICYYNDGTELHQYTHGQPNSFNDINQDKLIKFVLTPFTYEEEKEINKDKIQVKSVSFLPTFTLNLIDDRRLIYYRQNFIQTEEFHFCKDCNTEFQYNSSMEFKSKYPSPICPNCNSHDYFYCSKCDRKYDFEQTNNGLCPVCKGHLQRNRITSNRSSRERRWTNYIIGYQEKVSGRTSKFLLNIKETGDSEIL